MGLYRICFQAFLVIVILQSTVHVTDSSPMQTASPIDIVTTAPVSMPANAPPPIPQPPPPPGPVPATLPPLPTVLLPLSTKTTALPTTNAGLPFMDRWLDRSLLGANLKSILKYDDRLDDFSCGVARCGKQERRLTMLDNGPNCFCDKDCVALRDCCYDYKQSCESKNVSRSAIKDEDHEPSSCKLNIPSTFYGVTIINTCTSRNSPSPSLEKCTNENRTDILTLQPVLDLKSNKTYGNVFCASCNTKKDVALWRAVASCKNVFTGFQNNSQSQRIQVMKFIADNCLLKFYPPRELILNHRLCIPRLQTQNFSKINDSVLREKMEDLCESYAFPMCYILPDGSFQWVKNPHCLIYQGITNFDHLRTSCPLHNPSLPPLTIFFDFKETNSYTISSRQQNESNSNQLIKRQMSCPEGQGYDVFSGQCRMIYTLHPKNETDNNTSCKYIKLMNNEYHVFDNGSLLYAKNLVPKHAYYTVNNSIYMCVNLTKNFTTLESRRSRQSHLDNVLSVITVIGFVLSILGLILLIISYVVLPELRNLPGKIIISLSATMLAYLVLYFFINQSHLRVMCYVVGIGLHFCLLSMFCWMNVMAFDIHYTFTRAGQNSDRSSTSCLTGVYFKYALYAWLVPCLVITLSFGLEAADVINIGYVSGPYCFISNVTTKIYTLAIPVGLILLYNTVALCHTLFNIRKVQKQTVKVTNQKQKVDLPIVCIKMTSVMGITWVLGYLASFDVLRFLQYLHVILNSLQGFLIFISYVCNKRVYKMYRSYYDTLRGKHTTLSMLSKRSTNINPASTK